MNPGDEVDGPARGLPVPAAASASASAAPRSPASDAERAAAARMSAENDAKRRSAAGAGDASKGRWSVLLATATGPDARATALSVRDEIARRVPTLRDAFVSATPRGCVVLVGRFPSPKDEQAQQRLAEVKKVVDRGVPMFPRAMLTRTATAADQGPPGPNDLRSVRQAARSPDLFTVQVAAWSPLGSDEMTMDEARRAAEAYCRQLRSQGSEAYYFHDFDAEISTVTVGVFGRDAYDSRSTLFSPEVDEVMRKFPKSLLNGSEVLVPVDPANPGGRTVPQGPRLVEIPKF